MPAHPRQLVLQLLDQKIADPDLGIARNQLFVADRKHGLQFDDVFGQVIMRMRHAYPIAG